ncbi:MAG: DinB family protein [Thermoanaerobaculia bacterium]
MNAPDRHRRQLRFHQWAYRQLAEALEALDEPPERCVRWLAHLVASDSLWLGRILGRPQRLAVWPQLDLADCRQEMEQISWEWRELARRLDEEELDRVFPYTNSKGQPWESRVDDVLTHLVVHGAHHRGQIAAELRAHGAAPPNTDFIHAARTGALDGESDGG